MLLNNRRRARRAEVRGVVELMSSENPQEKRETQCGRASLWNSALQSHHPMLALDPCRQFPASDQYYQKLIVTVIVLP